MLTYLIFDQDRLVGHVSLETLLDIHPSIVEDNLHRDVVARGEHAFKDGEKLLVAKPKM